MPENLAKYSTQPYHDPSFLTEMWWLYSVGVFIIFLRIAVRLKTVGFRGWQGDDFVVILVLACELWTSCGHVL